MGQSIARTSAKRSTNSEAASGHGAFREGPVLAWLNREGFSYRDTGPFLEALAEELMRAGLDLCRLTTGILILHPEIDSSNCIWQRGQRPLERRFKLDEVGRQRLENSPIRAVYFEGRQVRQSLEGPQAPGEFPIYTELRAAGCTDYLAAPLPFSDGTWKAVTFVTQRIGGFAGQDLVRLHRLLPALARTLEVQTLHRTIGTLLDTYVGPTAGRRVLDGVIKRGMCERIHAVIWFCDLRGFTRLSEQLGGDELLMTLNGFFGAMTDAVGRHGGEVLKFIGDGLLAIFPLSGADGTVVAQRALAAAREAEAAIEALNVARLDACQPPIRYGLALHEGEVLYGNIGGTGRLDFTVIGRAVNIAARIERLCEPLQQQTLLSADFAALCTDVLAPLGTFPLKGAGTEQAVYAPPARALPST